MCQCNLDGGGERNSYLEAYSEQPQELQHQSVAVLLKLVNLMLVVAQCFWEWLLSFPINKFPQIHGPLGLWL